MFTTRIEIRNGEEVTIYSKDGSDVCTSKMIESDAKKNHTSIEIELAKYEQAHDRFQSAWNKIN